MSSSWSWLNFSDFSSVAGYTATGIVTRPNEMAPFHIDLGGMADLSSGKPVPHTHGWTVILAPTAPKVPGRNPARAPPHRGMTETRAPPRGAALTMKRMPDGIAGDYFYEKTAPSHTPDWIARCAVASEDNTDGVIGYLMGKDLAF